jgi:hypothetical protein
LTKSQQLGVGHLAQTGAQLVEVKRDTASEMVICADGEPCSQPEEIAKPQLAADVYTGLITGDEFQRTPNIPQAFTKRLYSVGTVRLGF